MAASAAKKSVLTGRKVPGFEAPSTAGRPFRPGDAAGGPLVIYFYPRDNTSGCTKEGIAFAELHPKFHKLDATVVGVSTDSLASHARFKQKFAFPFELLADEDESLCRLFDVIKEKSMYGKKYLGVERSTFLIDGTGVLRREWRKVKVDGHAEEVLEAAKAL
jgi:peroxiredoxin Q/BCP